MLEKWLNPPPPAELGRIAAALERLVQLQELALAAQGVTSQTFDEEGEVLETSPENIAAQEAEEERIKQYGLAPGGYYRPTDPEGNIWPPAGEASLFYPPGSQTFTVGPEGAESPSQPPEGAGRA